MLRKSVSSLSLDAGTIRSTRDNPLEPRLEEQILQEIFAARDDERRRVARELHDDLGQRLVLLSLAAAEALHGVPAGHPGLTLQLQSLHDEAVRLTHELRRIAVAHHLPIALSRGLQPALRELADDYRRRQHVRVRFRAVGVPRQLNPSIAYQIYRIAQEALRNVARHAGEAPVDIRMNGSSRRLRVEIRDFGKGFDSVEDSSQSLGLTIMRERSSLLGGTFRLLSAKGHGTAVTVEVPLEHSPNGKEQDK
jgi:two-component system CheB/CheR fusion protein